MKSLDGETDWGEDVERQLLAFMSLGDETAPAAAAARAGNSSRGDVVKAQPDEMLASPLVLAGLLGA